MSDKLVTNSIANAAITGNVISSGVITGSKIASGAITLAKLEPGFATKFAAGVKITNLYYDGLNTFADVDGGQTITLAGSGFTSNSKVVVNKSAASSVTVTNQYFLTFLSPPNPRGSYSVFVDNQNGATSFLPFAINYIPLLKFYSNSGAFGNLITPDNSVYEQISAIGDGTLVYNLESGALPSGIVLNANGTITGATTVTSVGNYNFNVSIFDNNLTKIYRDFYMTLVGGVRLTGTFYTAAGQGNLSASTTGGNVVSFVGGPFVTGGNVVIGSAAAIPFTFSNSTTISFTTVATTAGTYDVRINNTNGTYAFRRNFFTVRPPVTWVTAAGALTGTTETGIYNSNVSATSDGAITYSIVSGALPLGLTFFANGAISGTVTAGQIPAGQSTAYNFTINAVCINGQNQTRSFSITVTAVPAIYNYTLPGVVTALNTIGGETVTVNGFNFSVGAVAVVNGINATTNRISTSQLTFTSPAISSGTYTIRVRNSDGALSNTTNVTYSIAPSWTTAQSLGNFFETQTYTSIQLIATSDSALTYTLASGSLPSGLSLSSTGFITGVLPLVVVETGYSFTVTVTDAEFQTNSRTFSMTVILGSKLLSLSPAIDGKSSWNLKTDGDLAFPSFGTYTLTSSSATFFVANVKVYGAGGGDMATNERSGGLGGYTTGVIGFEPGVSYTVIVGEGGDATLTSKFAGGGAGGSNWLNTRFNAGSGGGYSGLFYSTTITQSTALLVAGGGGGGRGNRGGGGGGDGGETGESNYNVGGGGGTQAGPGAGGYFGPGEGTRGSSGSGSTGGTGGDTGGAGFAGGGGGGGGYYGGGGGPGGGGTGGAGGGGSGFVSANVSRVKFGYSITSQTNASVHGGANQ
jgi:Putative Ig domain/Glycine rich protein/IPT/TIG domain